VQKAILENQGKRREINLSACKKIRITSRDWELLKYLAEYAVVSVDTVGKIFGTEKYHEDRITELKKAKLISRKKNLVYLTKAGRELLEQNNFPCRALPDSISRETRYPKVADFAVKISGSNWDFIPSWRYKEERGGLSLRGARLYGVISNKEVEYAVYNIGKEPRDKSLRNLKQEIMNLPVTLGLNRAVIFAESEEAMQDYGEEPMGLMEQWLLLYNDVNLALLKRAASENLIKKAAQMLFEHGGPPEWKGADYTVDNGRQAVVLIFNDVEKIARLNEYAELLAYRRIRSQGNVVIVCLKDREEYYRQKYPRFEVMAVDAERLIEKDGGDKQ